MEPGTKRGAESVLLELGLSPTEAIRIFYRQIVLRLVVLMIASADLSLSVAIPLHLAGFTMALQFYVKAVRKRFAQLIDQRAGIAPGLMEYVVAPDPHDADEILAKLPPASLVVNATGMGKDRPGSPISDAGRFPQNGVVWEFNYRGSLEFLALARRQKAERGLVIEDGWRYFVHGWTQVIADVFDIPMPRAMVDELALVAAGVR